MAVKVTCIKKTIGNHENPHVAISNFGWINEETNKTGNSTRIQIYDFIKTGGIVYVNDKTGKSINLIALETSIGTKYVKTPPNDSKVDNLLSLEECK